MEEKIRLKDKDFELFIPESQMVAAIKKMAGIIWRDTEGKNPLFVGILNGAYMFTAELMSHLPPACELTFAAYSSYRGTQSEGVVQEVMPVRGNINNRLIILLEDVVDTGLTMQYVMRKLQQSGAGRVCLATMLFKPGSLKCDLKPDYVGMEIADDFVVGFGLDYDGLGRSSRNIYKVQNPR
ncbi:MAG: hypoxanthine phosphoribosyltransferase [Tannerella sp.]|jgi:hypoxanthine phosphoribosyltransferase|nr:hypoxanthine phosphoribosyltransferase [Tannerella sp.]